ncbi:MAG TPA: NCS2 family permease, partial [Chloroflexia bacterium]|nr:NCS2 family permease [Chloroflexia bacterium]
RGNRGALLIGIVGATIFSMIVNYLSMALTGASIYPVERGWGLLPKGLFALPTLPYFFGLSVFDAFFQANWVTTILNTFALMLSDFFDTMGTLVGVSMLAGFLTKEGRLPGVEKPLLVDSVGPIVGGAFAASSATTYIESGGGVAAGGRTGFVAVVVGLLFFLVPFFTPLIAVVPPQATSAALIVVGFFMIETIRHVEWGNFRQAFPVLLTMIVMPLTYSITNGIGFGFILYTLIAMFTGGARKVHPLMYIVSASFVIYFLIGALELWLGL